MNDTPQQVILTIRLMSNGRVEVSGPIHDRILCYGMLSAAQDAIHDFKPPEGPQIALVRAGAFPKINN